jgi:hypothetical protein
MVLAYYFAQELCEVRNRPGGGGLLVLGSSNVDECLRGCKCALLKRSLHTHYMTLISE